MARTWRADSYDVRGHVELTLKNLLASLTVACQYNFLDHPQVAVALGNFYAAISIERSTADEVVTRVSELLEYLSGDLQASGDTAILFATMERYEQIRNMNYGKEEPYDQES